MSEGPRYEYTAASASGPARERVIGVRKTRVWRITRGMWMVSYSFPYSGVMHAPYETWEDAFAEAVRVEKAREWA